LRSTLRWLTFLAAVLICILVYHNQKQSSAERAFIISRSAASSFGLKLEEFAGPEVKNLGIFGSNTYSWVKKNSNANFSEQLVYDPWENQVCWSGYRENSWKSFGCVVAKEGKN
jgi:hypothetical protein